MGGNEERIGRVVDYNNDVDAARIKLEEGRLEVGDAIHIMGSETEVEERVDALQLPHGPADAADVGDEAGIRMPQPVEEGANVFRVQDPYSDEGASVLDVVFDE